MDVLTPEQRRRNMQAIRGRDTGPEMAVRRLVHSMGYRYRLHHRGLPGRPDLVFRGRRKVIFVHGCYWHRHTCRNGQVVPATRRDFWERKFAENVERDRRARRELRRIGWKVLIVWECRTKDVDRLERRLRAFIQP